MAETPGPKRDGGGSAGLQTVQMLSPDPPGVEQAATGHSQLSHWNWGTLMPPCLARGRENASVWESGQRRRSNQMPHGNGVDRVKVHQGKTLHDRKNGITK